MHLHSFLILATSYLASTSAAALPSTQSRDSSTVLHFTLARRGGSFQPFEFGRGIANLTYLNDEVARVKRRYGLTRREVKGNKLVRKPKEKEVGGKEAGKLMSKVAEDGKW